MSVPFEVAGRIFQNACDFSVQCHRLPDYPPVDELIRETSRWFSELRDDEEYEHVKSLRMRIWRLRAHVLYSILPFNAQDLRLKEQVDSLQRDTVYFPYLQERIEKLAKIVQFLIENPMNLKREKVLELLRESGNKGRGVGLAAALVRGPTPGWSQRVLDEIRQVAPYCALIMSSKMLKHTVYRQIILPASGRLSPLIGDLYHGCRTARLDVVVYRKEGAYRPQRRPLPEGTFVNRRPPGIPETPQHFDHEPHDVNVDEWVQKRFWESLRGSTLKETSSNSQEIDREFLLKARIVILANNTRVYLREDMHIIEISDLLEGRLNIDDYGKKYPRCSVDQLREGDLIVLRTSGSGEYLIDFATSLMEGDGKGTLRTTALDWKPILKEALERHGSERIAGLLRLKGHNLGNHQYIWIWTTTDVIRPQSQLLFQDLIGILSDLGYSLGQKDPVEVADLRWREMKEIIRYHMMAGKRIRQSLLERLRKIIQDHVVITDCCHLSLPGLSAGEISVFRVAGVDTETIEIPYHQAGVITPLES